MQCFGVKQQIPTLCLRLSSFGNTSRVSTWFWGYFDGSSWKLVLSNVWAYAWEDTGVLIVGLVSCCKILKLSTSNLWCIVFHCGPIHIFWICYGCKTLGFNNFFCRLKKKVLFNINYRKSCIRIEKYCT